MALVVGTRPLPGQPLQYQQSPQCPGNSRVDNRQKRTLSAFYTELGPEGCESLESVAVPEEAVE